MFPDRLHYKEKKLILIIKNCNMHQSKAKQVIKEHTDISRNSILFVQNIIKYKYSQDKLNESCHRL